MREQTQFRELIGRSGLKQAEFSRIHKIYTGRGYASNTMSRWANDPKIQPAPSVVLVLMWIVGDVNLDDIRSVLDLPITRKV